MKRQRIPIVEAKLLIAYDLKMMLEEAGFEVCFR